MPLPCFIKSGEGDKMITVYQQFFDSENQLTDQQIIDLLENDILDDFEDNQYLPSDETIRELQF